MSHASIATPCPAPLDASRRVGVFPFDATSDDTAEIEFTRAIRHEFRNARPIRRQGVNALKSKRNGPIQIFEDVIEDQELVIDANKKLSGKTLLGKPAQKIRVPVAKKLDQEEASHPLQETGQVGRRASILPSEPQQRPRQASQPRHVRRKTIFVPADDTTIMTIHPGAGTERLNDTFFQLDRDVARSPEDGDEGSITDDLISMRRPVRRPRASLAAAPGRMPLAQTEVRYNVTGIDRPGQGGGKENHPPHHPSSPDMKKWSGLGSVAHPVRPSVVPNAQIDRTKAISNSKPTETTAAPRTSQSALPAKANSELQRPRDDPVCASLDLPQAIPKKSVTPSGNPVQVNARTQPSDGVRRATKRSSPSMRAVPAKRVQLREVVAAKRNEMQTAKLKQYPVLSENLAQPGLYEDGWLSQQETALTEVINEIFASTTPSRVEHDVSLKALREAMIEIYHRPETSTLHRRLQASLSYGALKKPKDHLNHSSLSLDLGSRKRFISLWLETYTLDALRTAAEVVVGRQIISQSDGAVEGMKSTERLLDPFSDRRSLTDFLETFFVNVSDVEIGDEVEAARWKKTMLRSLMLAWLLDQSKTSSVIHGCLFKPNSTRKSSSAVLHALSGLLLPSVGDISRALRHMDYEVTHVQDPLDEIIYRIDNLAVDLRDGVVLARLVETLLYTKQRNGDGQNIDNATITVHMPDATTLETTSTPASIPTNPPRVLSRHLKHPAPSRAQKLHNVQISLSALASHDPNIAPDLTPADIVDGHRERTLSLLWSLVSAHGIPHLLDTRLLTSDIHRLNPSLPSPSASASLLLLLQQWATTHASLHPSLPPVQNLTTSFADGAVYAAIIQNFTPHLSPSPSSPPLKTLISSLSCSQTFASSLLPSSSPLGRPLVPSSETTLATLTFLASRLLPLARRSLAARAIQRAVRSWLMRREVRRRVVGLRLAYACQEVVGARERIEGAARTVQRAWRRVLEARMTRMEGEVEGLQARIRGWGVRRGVWGKKGGMRGEVVEEVVAGRSDAWCGDVEEMMGFEGKAALIGGNV